MSRRCRDSISLIRKVEWKSRRDGRKDGATASLSASCFRYSGVDEVRMDPDRRSLGAMEENGERVKVYRDDGE